MRTAIALFALLTACSTTYECECSAGSERQVVHRFVDTDEDGLPDTRASERAQMGSFTFHDTDEDGLPDSHNRPREVIAFVDTDHDGLPDARLPLGADRARYQRIERSLESLERAIAEVRRAMR